MNPHISRRLARTLFFCFIGLALGIVLGAMQVGNRAAHVTDKGSRPAAMAGVTIGGPFTLTDQNGKAVTEHIFEGKYRLIYFGFTSCPAICPTELAKMTKALKALGEKSEFVQPVFITIDPERDTPDVIKQYLTLYDGRFIGLTGTKEQIDTVLKHYRVFAAKRQEPGLSDYSMDHSSFIYFIDPQGNLLSIFRIEDNADAVGADIKSKLAL